MSWDPNPDSTTPVPFLHFVADGYPESWAEGMDVYHNPNATHPLDPELLPMAAHHRLTVDQQIETTSTTAWKPIGSTTSVIELSTDIPDNPDTTR
ncbi:hypothetical protein [Nocardia pseudobrasiliensis]|nr:hypothetical protein [Nocardia pseudobrasiliensis]